MEFVKVMEIAKRYAQETPGVLQAQWYVDVIETDLKIVTEKALERFERGLLAWAKQHPEQTDTKEAKPMKTKVHELLGVEQGEEFRVSGFNCSLFMLDVDCTLLHKSTTKNDITWRNAEPFILPMLINRPERIIRHPAYTPEQVKVMKWLRDGEFKYVTNDECGCVWAYDVMPKLNERNGEWGYGQAKYHASIERMACLLPLIPDWRTPLDIETALKDAGEEV